MGSKRCKNPSDSRMWARCWPCSPDAFGVVGVFSRPDRFAERYAGSYDFCGSTKKADEAP
jgi:hypothetical protein